MKAAIIADLGPGADCVELPDVLVMDREWLRLAFGPHREESMMPQRELVQDETGRVGEVMGPPQPGSRLVALRPRGGGREWYVPADSVTPCDADGVPLQTPGEPT